MIYLVNYRINTLDGARKKAKYYGFREHSMLGKVKKMVRMPVVILT